MLAHEEVDGALGGVARGHEDDIDAQLGEPFHVRVTLRRDGDPAAIAAAGARSAKGTNPHSEFAVGCERRLCLIRLSICGMIDAVEHWHLPQHKWIDTLQAANVKGVLLGLRALLMMCINAAH